MRKIISVFARNYDTDRLVRNEVVPGAEWVLAGEGRATRKWDGSCAMIRDGFLYKRLELKRGKPAPPGFEPMQEPDEVTGAVPGWLRIGVGPEDVHWRGVMWTYGPTEGTYEAIGPHFGGGSHIKNPEGVGSDMLMPHGREIVSAFPRTFEGMKDWFEAMGRGDRQSIEGVVFHNPDGRMAKIKARDFGVVRPPVVVFIEAQAGQIPA